MILRPYQSEIFEAVRTEAKNGIKKLSKDGEIKHWAE